MSQPVWWQELDAQAQEMGHDVWSAGWYAAMRDLYMVRFPEADARSKANMRDMAEWAARRDGLVS